MKVNGLIWPSSPRRVLRSKAAWPNMAIPPERQRHAANDPIEELPFVSDRLGAATHAAQGRRARCPFADSRKQGRFREASMDGFTACPQKDISCGDPSRRTDPGTGPIQHVKKRAAEAARREVPRGEIRSERVA